MLLSRLLCMCRTRDFFFKGRVLGSGLLFKSSVCFLSGTL